MITIISLFLKFADSIQCKGPNTRLDISNNCVCIDGFPFGNPNSSEGCFKCDQRCHSNSICKYPGKCVCISPYYGDGVSNCIICRPHLYFVSPNSGPARGGTTIQIQYDCPESKNVPDVAYCKFGSQIEKSLSVTNSTIICLTPKHASIPTPISISFDSVTWSKENVFFNFIDFYFEDEDDEDENEYEFMNPDMNENEDEDEYLNGNENQNINDNELLFKNHNVILTLGVVFVSLFSFFFIITKNDTNNNELPSALK